MKKPTEILSDEHKNIIKVIGALTRECDALESGKDLDAIFFRKAIDFIRNYADKFHHLKEEDILFKEFVKNATELHCSPVDQMLHEHNLGRDFVKGMEGGLEENNKDKIIDNATGYAQLLKEHIFKEDNILYPMADETLSKGVKTAMLEKFKRVEQKKFKEGVKKYLKIMKEFEERK